MTMFVSREDHEARAYLEALTLAELAEAVKSPLLTPAESRQLALLIEKATVRTTPERKDRS